MASTLTTLALLYLAALIIPGPNLLLLTHTAASASRRAALGVALGIATGTLLWVAVAVFGVQQIFDALPALQTLLRFVGGCYLLHLAWSLLGSLWHGRNRRPADDRRQGTTPAADAATAAAAIPAAASNRAAHAATSWRAVYYRRGLVTNLTNPKSLAFWTSVAVVSLDPQASLATRLAAVAMVGVMGLLWHLCLAWLFSTAPAQQAYLRAKPMLSAITGAVMAAFGVRLLWSLRN